VSAPTDDSVVLRPAIAEDAASVARIWREGWADGHLGHVPAELVEVRTPESFEARARDRVPDTVVATIGDEVVGFTMVVGDEVEQVYLDRTRRGSGIAVVLLADAARQVAANGYDVAWLAVASGNTRAQRFYGRQGWRDEGEFDYPAQVGDATIRVRCHRFTTEV
jgi:ribosomal protein S18 acetylase RimI-like enzyme